MDRHRLDCYALPPTVTVPVYHESHESVFHHSGHQETQRPKQQTLSCYTPTRFVTTESSSRSSRFVQLQLLRSRVRSFSISVSSKEVRVADGRPEFPSGGRRLPRFFTAERLGFSGAVGGVCSPRKEGLGLERERSGMGEGGHVFAVAVT
jgi:hypothetical protein